MKRYFYKIYITAMAFVCGAGGTASGQMVEIPMLPSLISDPTVYSPQASAMIRYDEMPVNMSTGRLDLSIPLVNIPDKDFDFPISLAYNTDGFKPTEADNYVGHGWALRCGGVIYRQVRGIPDEISDHHTSLSGIGLEFTTQGFMSLIGKGKFDMDEMRTNVVENPYKYARSKDDYAPIPTIPGTEIETAPDMFFFNFGKHSGKFMINFDGTVTASGYDGHTYEVDLSDYKMTKGTFAHSTVIRIKTDDGYSYTFGGNDFGPIEYSAASWESSKQALGYGPDRKHIINTWYLTEIKAPNGRILSIVYKEIPENYHKNINELLDISHVLPDGKWQDIAMLYSLTGRANFHTEGLWEISAPPGELSDKKALFYYYNLTKIALIDHILIGDDSRIDFHYSLRKKHTEMGSIMEGFYRFRGAQLDSIQVSCKGEINQTHSFGYTQQCANRLFLTSLKHHSQGTYQFSYKMPGLDVRPTTSNIDHWGYWTGGSIDKDIMPGTRYPGTSFSYDFKLTTTLRDPSPRDCDATLLQSVVYPTGGKSTYEYEPHKYTHMFVQDALSMYLPEKRPAPGHEATTGGARIKKVKFYNEDATIPVKEIHYEYTSEMGNGGILTYMPLYRCIGVYLYREGMSGIEFENSDGFGNKFNPSQHILYPEVSEYYIDPLKGTRKEESPCKATRFYTDMRYYDDTDFCCATFTRPEWNPILLTLPGGFGKEYFLTRRFRWSGRNGSYKNGKVIGEDYYDANHALKKSVDYEYKDFYPQDYSLCIYVESIQHGSNYEAYTHINREYFGFTQLAAKQVTEYDETYQGITKKELYEYNERGFLKEQSLLLTDGDTLTTAYQYLKEMPARVTDKVQMTQREGISKILQCEHYDYRTMTSFLYNTSWPVISDAYIGTDPTNMEKRCTNMKYDLFGNLVYMERDEIPVIYVWGYQNQCLVAKIENAWYEEISNNSLDLNLELLSTMSVIDFDNAREAIDGLRDSLPQAQITTYTYGPNAEMTSATDPSGQTIFYEYDSQGRLAQTYQLNEKGKREILQLNEYNLVNE